MDIQDDAYWQELRVCVTQMVACVDRLVTHAVATEREACAKLCDEESTFANMQANNGGRAMDDGRAIGAEACAESIRARPKP